MTQIKQLKQAGVPVRRACAALGMAHSSYYHYKRQSRAASTKKAPIYPTPARALSSTERNRVHQLLNSDRFADQSPRQVYATMLDEGHYYCSISTMYRILNTHGEVVERRNQRQHPVRHKPQLEATAANQVWSWDITKLPSPHKHVYFYLYTILDVFSRYVVGWMLAEQESADLAGQLIIQTCQQQQIDRDQLTLHADNGSPMIALTTAQVLAALGVQKSHSRPYTPNDNPYSEAQFKTLKYRPDFPNAFESIESARTWLREFFHWYNQQHYHSGIALLTPATVHMDNTTQVLAQRDAILQTAYQTHPERFVKGQPTHPKPPDTVWINSPQAASAVGTRLKNQPSSRGCGYVGNSGSFVHISISPDRPMTAPVAH